MNLICFLKFTIYFTTVTKAKMIPVSRSFEIDFIDCNQLAKKKSGSFSNGSIKLSCGHETHMFFGQGAAAH